MKALYSLWFAAVIVLLFQDRNIGYAAIGVGGFSAFLVLLGKWVLPHGDDEPADALKQHGSRISLAIRGFILLAALAWSFLLGAALSMELPYLTELLRKLATWDIGFPRGGLGPFVTLTMALVPALLLIVAGAKLRDLGLAWKSGGPLRLLLWIAGPIAVGLWRLFTGYLSFWSLILIFLENALLNGLPEEFLFRGAILSYFRGFVATHWAFLVQAVLFSLVHVGITIPGEHGSGLLTVANVLALNLPIAVLFGLMALRSRSIAMGATIHFAMDAMSHLLNAHIR